MFRKTHGIFKKNFTKGNLLFHLDPIFNFLSVANDGLKFSSGILIRNYKYFSCKVTKF